MNIINKSIDKARAYWKLISMSQGKTFESIEIGEVPEDWENFPNTNDEWIGIPMPKSENSTACLYKGKAGSVFKPHKHPNNIEQVIIINEKGYLESITRQGIKAVNFPQSVFFNKNEVHAVKFKTDTTILIVWSPKFKKGWSADFMDKLEKCDFTSKNDEK